MIKRALLATAALLLVAHSASADALSKQKLTEILRDKEVAGNPERLLHAIGSQDLSLTRGEVVAALGETGAPRPARHLLSVVETLESKDGRVEMARQFANGVEHPDGRIMGFNSELSYWVEGRDLRGIRGLYASESPESGMERIRVVRNAVPPPAPEPEPQPSEAPLPDPQPLPQPDAQPSATPEAPPIETPAGPVGDPAAPPVTAPSAPPVTEERPAERPADPDPAPTGEVGTTAAPSIGIAGALRRSLKLGDSGDEVRAHQEELNRHRAPGEAAIREDGDFGARTKEAVTRFQAANGLPRTGVIDPATRAALESARRLRKGDKGAEVAEVQRLLNAQRGEGPALSEDEAFGARTEEAVKDFQRANGLPTTGEVDAATLTALRRASQPTPAPGSDPSPTVAPTTLERGQESDAVRDLQRDLNRHRRAAGLPPIAEDGKFGPGTERAVRDFQSAQGLDATGQADVGTAAELSKEPVRPTASRGDEGAHVKALQQDLNRHRRAAGLAPISEDGKFGAGTQRALEDFQRSKGLPTSGTADAGTSAELSKTPPLPSLERGAEGEAVKALQAQINQHRRAAGLAPISEDGDFGAGTKRALEEFQREKGLPTSGQLDSATQAALGTPPVEAPALKPGDQGARVKELQRNLNGHRLAKGERAISEDGTFGPGTEQALKDFQADQGLPQTGEADAATLSAADAAPDTSQNAVNASSAELEVLARIVKGECPANTPWEGKVAVAAVVLNRVRSRRFPNSIRGVAHQPKQFSCYNRNVRQRLYYGPIPDFAWRAARAALAGQDPSRGSTFYFNPFLVNPSWKRSLTFVRRIGNRSAQRTTTHDFYRE